MLLSDTNLVETTLTRILDIASTSPEMEKRVYSALESQLRHLQDLFFETTVDPPPAETSRLPTPDKPIKQRKQIFDKETISAHAFELYLMKRFTIRLSQKELINMAQEIGVKYGILISREEKRSKIKMFSWFSKNFEIMKDDINQYVRKLAQEKFHTVQLRENFEITSPFQLENQQELQNQ